MDTDLGDGAHVEEVPLARGGRTGQPLLEPTTVRRSAIAGRGGGDCEAPQGEGPDGDRGELARGPNLDIEGAAAGSAPSVIDGSGDCDAAQRDEGDGQDGVGDGRGVGGGTAGLLFRTRWRFD